MSEDMVERVPRTPTPRMMAVAWAIIDREKRSRGIARLGPGLGVRELWEAMYDASLSKQG